LQRHQRGRAREIPDQGGHRLQLSAVHTIRIAIHAGRHHDDRQQHDEHGVLTMIMSRYRRRKLAGQALIIFALAIMAMTGLLVIAVDGGSIYLDKRRLQNAASAGALAGGDAAENLPLQTYYTAHQVALNEIYHNLFPGTTVPTVPAGAAATYTTTAFSGTYQFVLTANVANLAQDTYTAVVNHAYTFFAAQALGFSS